MTNKKAFRERRKIKVERICKYCDHFTDNEDDMDQGWCKVGNCLVGKFEQCGITIIGW